MLLASSRSCLRSIHWSQLVSWEWRCSWSSANRRCSNYIWVINNFIAYWGATYIRGFTVMLVINWTIGKIFGRIKIQQFSLKENAFENVIWKWWPFCLRLNLSSYHINAAEIKLVQYNIFMKIKPTTSIMKTHIKHARIIGLVYKSISASSQRISNYDENCIESAIPDMNGNCRDQSRYEPSQLETSSQCNNISHWLGA